MIRMEEVHEHRAPLFLFLSNKADSFTESTQIVR